MTKAIVTITNISEEEAEKITKVIACLLPDAKVAETVTLRAVEDIPVEIPYPQELEPDTEDYGLVDIGKVVSHKRPTPRYMEVNFPATRGHGTLGLSGEPHNGSHRKSVRPAFGMCFAFNYDDLASHPDLPERCRDYTKKDLAMWIHQDYVTVGYIDGDLRNLRPDNLKWIIVAPFKLYPAPPEQEDQLVTVHPLTHKG